MSLYKREYVDTVYKADITLLVGPIDDLCGHFKKRGGDYTTYRRAANAKVIEWEHDNGVIEWFLWFPSWDPNSRHGAASLVHECMHLTFKILRHRGLKLTEESEEAYTYYGDALFRQFRDALDEYAAKQAKPARKKRR